MRVLEITCEPILHGGQEQFILNIISHNTDTSICIDVLTPYQIDNPYFCDVVEKHDGHVYGLNSAFEPGKGRSFLLGLISDFLHSHKYDIVHIHSGSISALYYAAKAAKLAGVQRRIVHSHCGSKSSFKHFIVRLVYGSLLSKTATDFLACSKLAGEDKYPKNVVSNHMHIIHNGIDLKRFSFDESARQRIRKLFEIGETDFVIGTVGRLSYQKNSDYLVDVLEGVKKKIPDCKLLYIGDGELLQEIKDKVHSYGLEDYVFFAGNVNNTEDYYQALDVFLLPSRFEGLPYVAIEAQASGLPCLLSSNISREVLVTDIAKTIDINDLSKWITCTADCSGKARRDRNEQIKNAGYDINDSVRVVLDLYRS